MFAATEYRALFARFFVLNRMENLATAKLRIAMDLKGDENLLASLHEELRVIHDEKLQLVSGLQQLVVSGDTSALCTARAQR